MFKTKFLVIFLLGFFTIVFFKNTTAQTKSLSQSNKPKIYEAIVLRIVKERRIKFDTKSQLSQQLELEVISGPMKDKIVAIETGTLPMANIQKYKVGDKVLINHSKGSNLEDIFYITDYIRRDSIIWLFFIFIVLVLAISHWQGLASLLAMGFTFLVIFIFIIPKIAAGADPVSIVILASLLIIPVTFCMSHGASKKTLAAIIGTVIALIITGIFSNIFVNAAHLTGFASEEAAFLQTFKQGTVNIKGLLLAGIIIGALGVLDDITISQSAIVFQLKETNPKIKVEELYSRTMKIGKDHISSMVNTLILVYTGASLPLFLLFTDSSQSFLQVINFEPIADEIIRTLVGSIGLILAVPITTIVACFIVFRK